MSIHRTLFSLLNPTMTLGTTLFVGVVLGGSILSGCGAKADIGNTRNENRFGKPDAGLVDSGVDSGDGGSGNGGSSGLPNEPDPVPYDDPGCPDTPEAERIDECDVFQENSCGAGRACRPYVIYPTRKCEKEVFGTACRSAGNAQESMSCEYDYCAEGLVCTVSGGGHFCLRLCRYNSDCSRGMICGTLDVEGFGACI